MGTTKTQLLRYHGSNILPLHYKPCLIFRLLNRHSVSRNLLFNVHNKLDLGAVNPLFMPYSFKSSLSHNP